MTLNRSLPISRRVRRAQVVQMEHERRIMAVAARPLPHGERLMATEDSSLTAWDPASGERAFVLKMAHAARVRAVDALPSADGRASSHLFASASSDGVVRVWDSRMATSSDSCAPTPRPYPPRSSAAWVWSARRNSRRLRRTPQGCSLWRAEAR